MNYNNSSSNSGLIQQCETFLGFDRTDISGNSNLLKEFTRLINDRYKQVSNWIWSVVGDWEFDDSNQTTLPIATTDLVANQQDYSLPSSAQKIERVEVKNSNGDYTPIYPFDKSQIPDIALSEYYETAGMPVYYDMVGRSLVLYPKPTTDSVTLTAGLKIYVSRDTVDFNSTATTQEPGFATNFHRILPLGACIDYAIGKSMFDSAKSLKVLEEETKTDMKSFYARRHKDPTDRPRINPNNESFV